MPGATRSRPAADPFSPRAVARLLRSPDPADRRRAVALLGDPAYYRRFDFEPAASLGIAAPDPSWGAYFQARVLTGPPVEGTFRYAAPFDRL